MQIVEYISSGGVVALVGLMWKLVKDSDGKVSRIYSRLDEIKKDNDEKFTRKDMCQLLHKQISDDLTEIKTDIKLMLRRNGDEK